MGFAFEQKIIAPENWLEAIGSLPRPLVFTNGVFDILHRGHVTYLAQARAEGASLVVALNGDASVRRLGKGEDRPVNELADRLCLVAALESVSRVTWFEEDTPLQRIRECCPDVLVKGGDWPVATMVGADFVVQQGGRVLSIPFDYAHSTTALLQRVRQFNKPV